jgi:hypothetical protein
VNKKAHSSCLHRSRVVTAWTVEEHFLSKTIFKLEWFQALNRRQQLEGQHFEWKKNFLGGEKKSFFDRCNDKMSLNSFASNISDRAATFNDVADQLSSLQIYLDGSTFHKNQQPITFDNSSFNDEFEWMWDILHDRIRAKLESLKKLSQMVSLLGIGYDDF